MEPYLLQKKLCYSELESLKDQKPMFKKQKLKCFHGLGLRIQNVNYHLQLRRQNKGFLDFVEPYTCS